MRRVAVEDDLLCGLRPFVRISWKVAEGCDMEVIARQVADM